MAGMTIGASGRISAEPNVIPMIDVLLVLLLIFMIASSNLRHALDVQLPPNTAAEPSVDHPQIVLELLPGVGFGFQKPDLERSGPAMADLANAVLNVCDDA